VDFILGFCLMTFAPALLLFALVLFINKKYLWIVPVMATIVIIVWAISRFQILEYRNLKDIKNNIKLYFHNDGQLELLFFAPFVIIGWISTIIYYCIQFLRNIKK